MINKITLFFFLWFSSLACVAEERDLLMDEVDKFVAAHLDSIQEKSFKAGREYCGLIFYDNSGKLTASKAKKGRVDSCRPNDVSEEFDVIASYHTHGAATHDSDTEVPSYDDLEADIDERIDGYIATPGGRFWLNDVETKKSIMLCGRGCLKSDPRFIECEKIIPIKEYTLDMLLSREENDDGEC